MFKEIIPRNPNFSDSFRKAITDYKFYQHGSDDTLFMVATALLHNRVDNLKLVSSMSRYLDGFTVADSGWDTDKGEYTFVWVEAPVDKIITTNKNARQLTNVEKFVLNETKQKVKVRVYDKSNTVLICMEKLDMPIYHFMISFMSLYFPVFKEKPLTKDETTLMSTLSLKTSTRFTQAYNEFVRQESFARFILKGQLSGFEKRIYQVKINAAKKIVDTAKVSMDQALENYRSYFNQYQDAIFKLEGIKSVMDERTNTSELEEYLINNKCLTAISLDGNYIKFIAKTYLYPYLVSYWNNIDSKGSIYKDIDWIKKDELRLLLNAIFSENRCLKLKMCGYFKMDYFGSKVTSETGYDFKHADPSLADYLPNTHLDVHNCFGQNMSDIIEQLKEGDVVGAIECCINVTKRININEKFTFNPMIQKLVTFQGKCLETKEGIAMSPKEAVEYMKGLNNGQA